MTCQILQGMDFILLGQTLPLHGVIVRLFTSDASYYTRIWWLLTGIGHEYKCSNPVATQLVVPTQLSDGPVSIIKNKCCINCHMDSISLIFLTTTDIGRPDLCSLPAPHKDKYQDRSQQSLLGSQCLPVSLLVIIMITKHRYLSLLQVLAMCSHTTMYATLSYHTTYMFSLWQDTGILQGMERKSWTLKMMIKVE